MTLKNIKITIALSSFLAIGLTSCLKDKDYDNRSVQSNRSPGAQKIVELGLTGTSNDNYLGISLDAMNKDTTFALVPITLASSEPATEDVNVTVVQNDDLVDDFNNNNGTAFEVPPASSFTIVNPGGVVTIPKGSNTGYLSIKINPNNFIGHEYALGYTISSVDKPGYTVSGNLKQGVVSIAIKNKYDGIYTLKLKLTGWAAYGIADGTTYTWPTNYQVITAGASSVSIFNASVGASQPGFTSTGGITAFGATSPLFTFDPATDKLISVINTTPDDGRGRAFQLNPDPSLLNKYDPQSKTIQASYIMKQNGRPNQLIEATFTFVKPR